MNIKTTVLLVLGMLAGVVVGALLGQFVPEVMLALGFLGQLFVNSLMVLVIALILTSLVVGIDGLGEYRKLGYACGKALVYFLVTGVVAIAVGLAVGLVMRPGDGLIIPAGTADLADPLMISERFGLYAGLILVAVLFGGVLTTMGVKARPVLTFFRGANETLTRLINLMFYVAPVGLLFLVGEQVAGDAIDINSILTGAGMYPLAVAIGLGAFVIVLLPIVLKVSGHDEVLSYFGKLGPAVLAAFGTASSTSALPFTYQAVVEKNDVDQRAGALVLPLGTLFNFGPTAMVIVIATLFITQATATPIGVGSMILLVLAALVASLGLAGVPRITGPLLVLVFGLAGVPAAAYAGIGIVVIAELLVDRLRSAANVCTDSVGAAVIEQSFEFQTAKRTVRRASPRRTTRSDRKSDRPAHATDKQRTGTKRGRQGRGRSQRSEGRSGQATGDKSPQKKPDTGKPKADEPSPFAMKSSSAPALEVDVPRGADTRSSAPSSHREAGKPSGHKPDAEEEGRGSRRGRKTASRRSSGRSGDRRSSSPQEGRRTESHVERDAQKPRGPEKSTPPETKKDQEAVARAKDGDKPIEKADQKPEPASEKGAAPTKPQEPAVAETGTPHQETSDSAEGPADPGRFAPSEDMIRRELTRVSAQLRSMSKSSVDRSAEERTTAEPDLGDMPEPGTLQPPEADIAENESVPETPPVAAEPEKTEAADMSTETPAVEVEKSHADEPAEISSDEEKAETVEADGPSEEEKQVAASFGRSRRHRGRPPKEHKPESVLPEEEPVERKDSFTSENISFGRTKRKRTR